MTTFTTGDEAPNTNSNSVPANPLQLVTNEIARQEGGGKRWAERDNPHTPDPKHTRYQAQLAPHFRGPSRAATIEQAKLDGQAAREAAGVERAKDPRTGRRKRKVKRSKRSLVQIAMVKEVLRRALIDRGLPVDEEKIHKNAEALWEAMCRKRNLPDKKRMLEVTGEQPDARIAHPFVMHRAKRQTKWGQEITRRLSEARGGVGAPHKNIAVAVAVIERNLYETSPIEIKRAFQDLTQTSIPLLEWAYDSPVGNPSSRQDIPSRSAVYECIDGRPSRKDGAASGDREPGILDRVDPDFLKDGLVESYGEMLKSGCAPNAGDLIGFDGTRMPIAAEQVQSVSPEHENLLNGRFTADEVAYATHGKSSSARGKVGLFLTDPMCPQMTMNASLPRYNDSEAEYAIPTLHDYYCRYFKIFGCHALTHKKFVADRAFFTHEFCEKLVFHYGLDPVIPWQGRSRDIPWGDNYGVPYCQCSAGKKIDLKWKGQEGFLDPVQRDKHGLQPGDDVRPLLKKLGRVCRICWQCPACKKWEYTYPGGREAKGGAKALPPAAHIYTRLPYKDTVHKSPTHAALFRERRETQVLRNSSESLNSTLKRQGFGLDGAIKPTCIKSDRQIAWYALGRLLSINLQRVVMLDGTFLKYRNEVRQRGLDLPGSYIRLREAGFHQMPGEREPDDDIPLAA